MTNSNNEATYSIEVVNYADATQEKARVMICQLDFDQMCYEKESCLYVVSDNAKNRAYLRQFLAIAQSQKVDLLVFPELTIPSGFIEELRETSSQFDMYIIGGTHYKKTEKGYLSLCPIVTPQGRILYTEKLFPAPSESSCFNGGADGAITGESIKVVHGSKIGDFAVTICLDYTRDDLRVALGKDSLDFLIVTAFNSKSDEFFYTMHSDVQRSADGLFVVYCNAFSQSLKGEGRSALFAVMDDCYKKEFFDKGCTDFVPKNKIYEFSKGKSYCVFEVDLQHKKPYLGKNSFSRSNVLVIEEDNGRMEARYQFQKLLGAPDDKYKFIDKFYVKPREYDEMLSLLEREHVLVITGDAGIGKTYTAIRFLYEYYNKGFKPTWFYGMAKEDRDEQRVHLLNFEPQDKDVVYIEDPFGRTVFESREELKTLFSNLVERFRVCKAKLIITSREEVFKKFKQEVLTGDRLDIYKKELNVRKPSYRTEDLKEIARHYIDAYTNWGDNKDLEEAVMLGIERGLLFSPLMIYNLVNNHRLPVNKDQLEDAINAARGIDLVTQFADEIKILSHPARLLLYMVLLYGKKNIAKIRELFPIIQAALMERTRFEGSSFSFELNGQENHRIQRLGEMIPVYRLSHPSYEEALIGLAKTDSTCSLINETCLSVMIQYDNSLATDVFNRFVIRYPEFVEGLMKEVISPSFQDFKEPIRLELARKMILSEYVEFQESARRLCPIQHVINALYEGGDLRYFELRLRTLNRRKDELNDVSVEWERVFTTEIISRLHPTTFIECYAVAESIDNNVINSIERNFQRLDIIRKFILLPTDKLREEFNRILCGTRFSGIYPDLKEKIPNDIMGSRVNKRRYVSVYRKYVLKMSNPKGIVYLDEGAMRAVTRAANLYPIGVIEVVGEFEKGDIIYLSHKDLGRSVLTMSELSSEEILAYKGLHSSEIYEMNQKIVPTTVSRPYYRGYIENKIAEL